VVGGNQDGSFHVNSKFQTHINSRCLPQEEKPVVSVDNPEEDILKFTTTVVTRKFKEGSLQRILEPVEVADESSEISCDSADDIPTSPVPESSDKETGNPCTNLEEGDVWSVNSSFPDFKEDNQPREADIVSVLRGVEDAVDLKQGFTSCELLPVCDSTFENSGLPLGCSLSQVLFLKPGEETAPKLVKEQTPVAKKPGIRIDGIQTVSSRFHPGVHIQGASNEGAGNSQADNLSWFLVIQKGGNTARTKWSKDNPNLKEEVTAKPDHTAIRRLWGLLQEEIPPESNCPKRSPNGQTGKQNSM
jgi:hypothetical protein